MVRQSRGGMVASRTTWRDCNECALASGEQVIASCAWSTFATTVLGTPAFYKSSTLAASYHHILIESTSVTPSGKEPRPVTLPVLSGRSHGPVPQQSCCPAHTAFSQVPVSAACCSQDDEDRAGEESCQISRHQPVNSGAGKAVVVGYFESRGFVFILECKDQADQDSCGGRGHRRTRIRPRSKEQGHRG